MSDLTELLETSNEGNRHLDEDVLLALGFKETFFPMDSCPYWVHPSNRSVVLADFEEKPTRLADAAISILNKVANGWKVASLKERTDEKDVYVGGWSCRLHCPLDGKIHNVVWGVGNTPGLAICSAIVKIIELEKIESKNA